MAPTVTIGFSTHRAETLEPAFSRMAASDAVYLEEPPTPGFDAVLRGDIDIEAYLPETETEYPEFSRRALELLRGLHSRGVGIFQVEPFLEALLRIHEHLAEGGGPGTLPAEPPIPEVYRAEKEATGRLIEFYEKAASGDFEETVEAVKRFAKADASRIRLRDRLRAEALAPRLASHGRAYVEAGYIHLTLFRELKKRLPGDLRVKCAFLESAATLSLTGRRHLFSPGDLLTFRYLFGSALEPAGADLLAARSLIHSQILGKEEMLPGEDPIPHLRNEWETDRMVRILNYADCRRLHARIRRASTVSARSAAMAYLSSRAPGDGDRSLQPGQ